MCFRNSLLPIAQEPRRTQSDLDLHSPGLHGHSSQHHLKGNLDESGEFYTAIGADGKQNSFMDIFH